MTSLIRKNTAVLNQLTMLYGEKKNYEKDLDKRQKNLVCPLRPNIINESITFFFLLFSTQMSNGKS